MQPRSLHHIVCGACHHSRVQETRTQDVCVRLLSLTPTCVSMQLPTPKNAAYRVIRAIFLACLSTVATLESRRMNANDMQVGCRPVVSSAHTPLSLLMLLLPSCIGCMSCRGCVCVVLCVCVQAAAKAAVAVISEDERGENRPRWQLGSLSSMTAQRVSAAKKARTALASTFPRCHLTGSLSRRWGPTSRRCACR
jgi:hypothetical protein